MIVNVEQSSLGGVVVNVGRSFQREQTILVWAVRLNYAYCLKAQISKAYHQQRHE